MTRILVVEDDPSILRGIADNLVFENYEVLTEVDGEAGLRVLREMRPDLVILDLMLPKLSGHELCRRARKEGITTPIIMVTARGEESDRIGGLDLGADDYISKPFAIGELLARIRAVLRRVDRSTTEPDEVVFDDVRVDFKSYETKRAGRSVEMTPKEYAVLRYLTTRSSEVVGRDARTDIAVLKIEASDLEPITIADSDTIEVGDVVLAVGNPFGIGQTVTMGLVSATRRAALGLKYENFIQTDAPINPGNSGGALIDAVGRLIGINTAILSRSGGNQGIGFAVPINLARFVMESIVRDGRVIRGYMGVILQPMTPGLAKQFQLSDSGGALVAEVAPNTPAAKAGLKDGDVILEVDGKPIRDSRALTLQVSQTSPGTKVVLKVLREGERRKVDVLLKEFPDSLAANEDKKDSKEEVDALNGVTVADLDRGSRSRYGIPPEIKGAIVVKIEEDSPAAEGGLRVGDVVREMNRKPVTTADEAVELSEKIKDQTVLLRVWTPDGNGRGSNRYVVVQEEKRK